MPRALAPRPPTQHRAGMCMAAAPAPALAFDAGPTRDDVVVRLGGRERQRGNSGVAVLDLRMGSDGESGNGCEGGKSGSVAGAATGAHAYAPLDADDGDCVAVAREGTHGACIDRALAAGKSVLLRGDASGSAAAVALAVALLRLCRLEPACKEDAHAGEPSRTQPLADALGALPAGTRWPCARFISQLVACEVRVRGGTPSDFRGVAGAREWQYVWLPPSETLRSEDRGRELQRLLALLGAREAGERARMLACHGSLILFVPRLRTTPRLSLAENLISAVDAQAVIELATPTLHPSRVVAKRQTGEQRVRTRQQLRHDAAESVPGRTSHSCKVSPHAHPALRALVQRVSFLLGLTPAHAEPVQVLRYLPGEQYKPHYDYFDPAGAAYADAMSAGGRGQRVATAFVYLTTLPDGAGGTTTFHRSHPPVSVPPKLGRGALWRNVLDCGAPDENSLHSGDRVNGGPGTEKWAVNIFFRERPRPGGRAAAAP